MGDPKVRVQVIFSMSDLQKTQWKAKCMNDGFVSAREWIQLFLRGYLENDPAVMAVVEQYQQKRKRLSSKVKKEIEDGKLLAGALGVPEFEFEEGELDELYDLTEELWDWNLDELYGDEE